MISVIAFQIMSLLFLYGLNLNVLYSKLNKYQKNNNPPNKEENFFEHYLFKTIRNSISLSYEDECILYKEENKFFSDKLNEHQKAYKSY